MLKLENVDVFYGTIHALHGVNFEVNEGEIVTLIGANGAGKSSTLNTISGLVRPKSGRIIFMDKILNTISADKIVANGLCQVPEGRKIFANLTVLDNLELGAYARRDKNKISSDLENVFTRFPRLKERMKQVAGTLSGGEQQMLAIRRGLMSRPKLMLLDEPSMGLSPILVHEVFNIIQEINKDGTTVLLVEQNAHMALSIADRAYILETGHVTISGSAKDLAQSEEVKKAYLGG